MKTLFWKENRNEPSAQPYFSLGLFPFSSFIHYFLVFLLSNRQPRQSFVFFFFFFVNCRWYCSFFSLHHMCQNEVSKEKKRYWSRKMSVYIFSVTLQRDQHHSRFQQIKYIFLWISSRRHTVGVCILQQHTNNIQNIAWDHTHTRAAPHTQTKLQEFKNIHLYNKHLFQRKETQTKIVTVHLTCRFCAKAKMKPTEKKKNNMDNSVGLKKKEEKKL